MTNKELRLKVLRRDNYTCHECGDRLSSSDLQVDHIKQRGRDGGLDGLQNLRAMCKVCHTIMHSVERSTAYMLGSVMDEVFGSKPDKDPRTMVRKKLGNRYYLLELKDQ
ncbi:MAG: HNH endonuclease [Nitrososphaeraceae archaeon]